MHALLATVDEDKSDVELRSIEARVFHCYY
jgi:hypothetical protein